MSGARPSNSKKQALSRGQNHMLAAALVLGANGRRFMLHDLCERLEEDGEPIPDHDVARDRINSLIVRGLIVECGRGQRGHQLYSLPKTRIELPSIREPCPPSSLAPIPKAKLTAGRSSYIRRHA